eukprot:844951-Prorocentrum_minimum.AAC.1
MSTSTRPGSSTMPTTPICPPTPLTSTAFGLSRIPTVSTSVPATTSPALAPGTTRRTTSSSPWSGSLPPASMFHSGPL